MLMKEVGSSRAVFRSHSEAGRLGCFRRLHQRVGQERSSGATLHPLLTREVDPPLESNVIISALALVLLISSSVCTDVRFPGGATMAWLFGCALN
jgi:hypothetical protein